MTCSLKCLTETERLEPGIPAILRRPQWIFVIGPGTVSVFHHSGSTLCHTGQAQCSLVAPLIHGSLLVSVWWHSDKMLLSSRSRETVSCFIRLRQHVTLAWPALPVAPFVMLWMERAEYLTHIWNIWKLTFDLDMSCESEGMYLLFIP